MTPENFCYWLQGFFEIADPKELTPEQLQEVKNHLSLVFNKVTPIVTKFPDYQVFTPPTSSGTSKFCRQPLCHASC